MELALNIAYYSDERPEQECDCDGGIGNIQIYRENGGFCVYSVNKIENGKLDEILDKCKKINSLDRKGLREFKIDMSMQPRSRNGGANIGLIQIALAAENPLRFETIPFNEEFTYLALTIRVN